MQIMNNEEKRSSSRAFGVGFRFFFEIGTA